MLKSTLSWKKYTSVGTNMSYACQLIFTCVIFFTNMFRFDLLWPVGVPNASDFLKCRASSNPSHPARLLYTLVIRSSHNMPQRLSWGNIVYSRCSSVLLVLLSKWPSLKDVISQIKTSSVWQRWYDTSFLSFDNWYSPWSNRSIISAKSMISYSSCHQEFPGCVNYILNKLILSSF